MQARFVCSVFSVWLFAIAEQVTAVRDVLCLSHKPKSNRSESVVRVATEPLLLYPAYFRSLSPPVCHCVLCVIRRDLTQSITEGEGSTILGMNIRHDRVEGVLTLSHESYLKRMFGQLNLGHIPEKSVPIKPGTRWSRKDCPVKVNQELCMHKIQTAAWFDRALCSLDAS